MVVFSILSLGSIVGEVDLLGRPLLRGQEMLVLAITLLVQYPSRRDDRMLTNIG